MVQISISLTSIHFTLIVRTKIRCKMADTNRPILVFVPGACHTPEVSLRSHPRSHVQAGVSRLKPSPCLHVGEPSLPPKACLQDDIDHVHATLACLADDAGRRIVAVAPLLWRGGRWVRSRAGSGIYSKSHPIGSERGLVSSCWFT
jgi:hypothetical protein